MNYTSLIELLSACGVCCVLINSENTIISINEKADWLLDGHGQLPGQKLPDCLIPMVDALRAGKQHTDTISDSWNASTEKNLPFSTEYGISTEGFSDNYAAPDQPPVYARTSFMRYVCCEALLDHPLLPGNTQLLIVRDGRHDHALDMAVAALDRVHEAVVMCDEEDRMYYCNEAALEIDDLTLDSVRGQHINDVYENDDSSPLSIPQVRKSRMPSLNHRQLYHTRSGQQREIIANFYPVLRGSETLGAFSVLEDWDTASSLQRKVIDLQDRLLDYEQERRIKASEKSLDGDKKNTAGASSVNDSILQAKHQFSDFVQQSSVARNTVKLCTEAAATEHPVFLYGEPGTGKHFLAQCIHNASARSAHPFLHFNCASLPHVLLDDMLFGSVRIAPQDVEEKRGLLSQAEGGTLYLSEIETMSLELQRKLLHVLQDGFFVRNGDKTRIPLHARFIISTSLSPEKGFESKKLDPSLFNYLQHYRIMVPPLRTRRVDIIPLTMEFVNAYNHRYEKKVVNVSDNVFTLFKKHSWTGNIKELKQAIGYAINAIAPDAEILTSEYLPSRISHIKKPVLSTAMPAASPDAVVVSRPADSMALKDTVTEIRRQSIYQILLKNGGNITKAAAEMGLSRQNLQYHIRQCGIDLKEIRTAAKKNK